MLETIQATADVDLVGDPFDLSQQVSRDPNLWRRIGSDKARLHGDASSLGSLVIRRAAFGDHKGRCQVIAEANLTSMVYGKAGKTFTLPRGDLAEGLQLVVDQAVKALPSVAPRTLSAWKVSRVDASVTWALQPLDAPVVFEAMRNGFFALQGHGGRAEASQPGPHSLMLQRTKEDKVRLYNKTDETLANGGSLPTSLSPNLATLVRLESQIVARTARRKYGETLEDLANDGNTVATLTLSDWLGMLGQTSEADAPREALIRLTNGGMSPERAFAMVGPALILRAEGRDGLMRLGISKRTANRWAAEIRAVAPDSDWTTGVDLRLEDAVYADQFCDRIA